MGGVGLLLMSSQHNLSPIHIGRGQCLEGLVMLHVTWLPGNGLSKHVMRVLQLLVGGTKVKFKIQIQNTLFCFDVVTIDNSMISPPSKPDNTARIEISQCVAFAFALCPILLAMLWHWC